MIRKMICLRAKSSKRKFILSDLLVLLEANLVIVSLIRFRGIASVQDCASQLKINFRISTD
jgi:hypothetical protein